MSAHPPPPETDARRRACAACSHTDAEPLFSDLVRCTACGMVYYPKRLSPDEVSRLYDRSYFTGAEYYDYLGEGGAREANFRVLRKRLARWLPPGRRLFEIGCAYGFFLNGARSAWRVSGCDVAADACRHAREQFGLDVRCDDFTNVPIERGAADAFCMWDVIEHVDTLDACMAKVAATLEPGGLLALTTGDIGSWLARRQGPRWRQIHPPTHIWYFSRETIARLLDRFGFDMVAFRHIGVWRSLGQIVYSLTSLKTGRPSRVHQTCVRLGLDRLQVWLNTLDLMWVVARRR